MPSFDYTLKALREDPAVTFEEIRRAEVAEHASKRLVYVLADLEDMVEKDLRQKDPLAALEALGEQILSLALHTRGLLRSAEGRSDAFLEATAANVQTGLRRASIAMGDQDKNLSVWAETLELLKPVQKDVQRISEGLERPGIKSAVTPPPSGALFDGNGEPMPLATPA